MNGDLLRRLDRLARDTGRSRSALVRDAVERYVVQESEAEKDRRLIQGYRQMPQSPEELAWADASFDEMLENEETW